MHIQALSKPCSWGQMLLSACCHWFRTLIFMQTRGHVISLCCLFSTASQSQSANVNGKVTLRIITENPWDRREPSLWCGALWAHAAPAVGQGHFDCWLHQAWGNWGELFHWNYGTPILGSVSRLGWMGLWPAWSLWEVSLPMAGRLELDEMIFKVPYFVFWFC